MLLRLIVTLIVVILIPVKALEIIEPDANCTTFYGAAGTCIPLYLCPPLLKAFANPLKGIKKAYLQFRCRDDDTYICCEPSLSTEGPQLSDRSYCGFQRIDDFVPIWERVGMPTSIDEFPWLAAIIAPKLNKIVCQGVLISRRYVLTATQCFVNREYKAEDVTEVRLGGYDVKNTTYCVEYEQYDATDCTTTEIYGVEEYVLHDFFYGRVGLNDIALVRLDRVVVFTDFIRPICLPVDGTVFAKPGDTLYVTGWGEKNNRGELAQVKKKIVTTLLDGKDCEKRLWRTPVRITPLKMCALDAPSNTEFTCSGDAGAPLMFVHRNQWHIEGITIKGLPCGRGFPEVKTKVSGYLDWIRHNLKN